MKLMKRNGMSVTNMCPLCNNEVEDWDHVFRCRSMVARVERELQLQQLKQKLQRRCTAPILVKRILAVLRQWTNTYPIQIKDDNIAFSRINQAFLDQCNLGVSNLFAGVITYKFGMLQEQYYIDTQQKGSKFTRSEWNIWLVRALGNFDLRMHSFLEGTKISFLSQPCKWICEKYFLSETISEEEV